MKDCILVVLSKEVSTFFIDESPSSFEYEGDLFLSQFQTDNNGFFDWLRNNSKKIIGVRWSAYSEQDAQAVEKKIAGKPNSEIDVDGNLLIYFGLDTEFDESISCDQDFGDNNFYISQNGLCAMSFSSFCIDSLGELGS